MSDNFGAFKPTKEYGEASWAWRFSYSEDLCCGVRVFVDITLAESELRESVQRAERLEDRLRMLQKTMSGDDETKKLYKCDEELNTLRKTIDLKQQDLCDKESLLPRKPLKDTYDKIRQNPAWYLDEEFVKDCIGRGGCCSRGCRCCEKRHLGSERRKGIGHCTVECGCCASYRGYDYTEEERKDLAKRFSEMLWDPNPSHLLAMTEAYFAEPRKAGPAVRAVGRTAAKWWRRLFGAS